MYDSICYILRNIKTQGITTVISSFIALGVLKSLLCFPLNINIDDISIYRTDYLLRKCRKKKNRK